MVVIQEEDKGKKIYTLLLYSMVFSKVLKKQVNHVASHRLNDCVVKGSVCRQTRDTCAAVIPFRGRAPKVFM
jgi:hypothetical protein